MNLLRDYFHRLKKYLTFYDTNNYKNGNITHVPHLLSMKHIFLEENTASLSIQKKERKKKFGFEQ